MRPDTMVIVNPASAGGRTGRAWPSLARRLADAGVAFESRLTRHAGQATRLAREALRQGCPRIVAVGGDGTLNEVLNGFFDADGTAIAPHACLGMLASGTGGDFRRSAGIPASFDEGCALLASGEVRAIDVGRIEFEGAGAPAPRHFVNVADCGIGGEVVTRVNRGRKLGGSRAVFLYHSLATLLTYRARPARIEVDGEVVEETVQNVVVANGRFFGGSMMVAPGARLDDGLFDVVVFGDIPVRRSLLEMRRIYRGTHIDRPGVRLLRGARVRVEPLGGPALLFDVEGEQVGRAPATVTCRPGALLLCARGPGG